MSTRFVFFGTPRFATIILDELATHNLLPSLIVTQEDKPQGRGLHLAPSPVKEWALAHAIPCITPSTLDAATLATIAKLEPEMFVVAAYGKILRPDLLAIPRRGTLNVHPSLLPKFRGSSPIESTILSKETSTGATIMLLDDQMDHGPILAQHVIPMTPWPPKGSVLHDTLAHEGGKLLASTIPPWIAGAIAPSEQRHADATYTKKIARADAEVDLDHDDAQSIWKKFLAFDARGGIFFFVNKGERKIRVRVTDADCSGNRFVPTMVIPEGGREMPYGDFERGL